MANELNNAAFIELRAGVCYWEDARINGIEDTGGHVLFRRGDYWCPVISLEDGTVMGWPEGIQADINYKVCDDGEYWLLDDSRQRFAKWNGDYVPNRFLCHGDNGFGDYIIFKIGTDGKIAGFQKPELHFDDWSLMQAQAGL